MKEKNTPKITFGIIVLNGEPFTRYCLRALYPFAHEIIVAEGASTNAAAIATKDGHSRDGTLKILRDFKEKEDPENKIIIVIAEDEGHPNGFWPGEKDEQSQAYAKRATGDYLWQVDIDEFYRSEDLEQIIQLIQSDSKITQMNFVWQNFWGGFSYTIDGFFLKKHYKQLDGGVPRLFKWGKHYQYITHRPPTVYDENDQNLKDKKLIGGEQLKNLSIYCYHYSTVFPKQVEEKMKYYDTMNWAERYNFRYWFKNNFIKISKPFRIHHATWSISWIKKFEREHPKEIENLIADIENGVLDIELRSNQDVEKLVNNKRYNLGMKLFEYSWSYFSYIRVKFPKLVNPFDVIIEKIFSPKIQ